MPAPEVVAVRSLIERTARDGDLPGQRSRALEAIRSDLADLVGQIDSRLASSDLRAQAGAISEARLIAAARENATARDELIRRGIATPDELDAAGVLSHAALDQLDADGQLPTALEEGAIAAFVEELHPRGQHGKFAEKLGAVKTPKVPEPKAPAAKAPDAPRISHVQGMPYEGADGSTPAGMPGIDELDQHGLNEWPKPGPAAQQLLGEHADTQSLHRAGGMASPGTGSAPRYTAARKVLHDQIVAQALEGKTKPEGKPRVLFMAGGAASGKTKALEANPGVVPDNAVHIDPDAIKEQLPEYQALRAAGDRYAAAASHEESSDIAKRIQGEAMRRGLNAVVDGTGNSGTGKFAGKLKDMNDAGYDVHALYVTVPTDVAVTRAVKRAQETGRFVPVPEIRNQHQRVSANYQDVSKLPFVKNLEVYDNGGESARRIASAAGGKVKIIDPERYQAFVDKANEGAGGA